MTLYRDTGPTRVAYRFVRGVVVEEFGVAPTQWPMVGKAFHIFWRPTNGGDPERARFLRVMTGHLGYDNAGVQIEHVHDLQFGGADHFQNLWPADSAMNMSAGGRHRSQLEKYRRRLGNIAVRLFVIVAIHV